MFLPALAMAVATALPAPLPHDPGLSSLTVIQVGAAVEVTATFANADFAAATNFDRNHDRIVDSAELAAAAASLPAWAESRFLVTSLVVSLRLVELHAVLAANDDVECTMRFEPFAGDTPDHSADDSTDDLHAEATAAMTLSMPFLRELSHGHRCYASVHDAAGELLADALLHREHASVTATFAGEPGRPQRFGQALAFFVLGIEHILIGFDHLAFLLVLLAAGITIRGALATITAFTVAHSVTLIAATLDLVRLPSLLVEAAIAVSIVVVAVANVLQRRQHAPYRWQLAFAFGLIHGFGFASVLAGLFERGQGVILPLLTFNLGVEFGQLLFAAAAVPLLMLAGRFVVPHRLSIAVSVAGGIAGICWLLERLA